MKKKYLFLDIDFTLYAPQIADTPASARKAIHLARKNGSKVFLCTGRSLAEASKYLNYEVDGFIFAAGAMIYAERKRIYDHPLSEEAITAITALARKNHMGYCMEGAAGAYGDEEGMRMLRRYFSGGEKSDEVMTQMTMANGVYPEYYRSEQDPIYKICVFSKHGADFTGLEKQLPEPYVLTITIRDPKFHDGGEITDGRVTKATGIQKVLEYYHADRADSVGIGDSDNDIPMIRECGMGIAMGNAFEEVKKEADFVTTDILDNGIWNAFIHAGVISGEEEDDRKE